MDLARRRCAIAVIAFWFAILATPLQALEIGTARDRYGQALTALANGDEKEWSRLVQTLGGYPLAPYLDFHRLKQNLDRSDSSEVRAFLARHAHIAAASDLQRAWLQRLANEERWQDYLADYTPQRDPALRCAQLTALLATGQPADLTAETRDLWLAPHSQPERCDPIFDHWLGNGQLNHELIAQRAVASARAGHPDLARFLGRGLAQQQRDLIDVWITVHQHPETVLQRASLWSDGDNLREQLLASFRSLARQDAALARSYWPQLESRFAWLPAQRTAIERDLALYYATDYPPDAFEVLMALPNAAVDSQIRKWRIRVALKEGRWSEILNELDGLSAAEQNDERWRYWRARSLEASGYRQQASVLYHALANEANYYGFLAADRSGHPYALCPELRDPHLEQLSAIAKMPAMQRAIELFHVGDLHYARLEWARAMRELPLQQHRQAALLAHAEGWHDRAVLTLAASGHRLQYAVRFPLAWDNLVSRQASLWRLNPSLIYGVMRSESALVIDAVSGAGARGLMQLTPATGRQIAQDKRLPIPTRSDLLRADTSISLGSAYLDSLFDRFGHPLEVLAAYNAGPSPVEKWRTMSLPSEADRWVETLPYFETRDYLPRVLAFATIYDWRRSGRMLPLTVRMPSLNARPGKTDLAQTDPLVPVCTPPTLSVATR